MKKYLTILLALSANFAVQTPSFAAEKQPSLALRIFDVNNGVSTPLEGSTYSVGKKTQQLCWIAFNMDFGATNTTVEVFKSPSKANFVRDGASIEANSDKTLHTVTAHNVKPSNNNSVVTQCWRFDESDPLGNYSVTVRVNNIQFPPQTFSVVK